MIFGADLKCCYRMVLQHLHGGEQCAASIEVIACVKALSVLLQQVALSTMRFEGTTKALADYHQTAC